MCPRKKRCWRASTRCGMLQKNSTHAGRRVEGGGSRCGCVVLFVPFSSCFHSSLAVLVLVLVRVSFAVAHTQYELNTSVTEELFFPNASALLVHFDPRCETGKCVNLPLLSSACLSRFPRGVPPSFASSLHEVCCCPALRRCPQPTLCVLLPRRHQAELDLPVFGQEFQLSGLCHLRQSCRVCTRLSLPFPPSPPSSRCLFLRCQCVCAFFSPLPPADTHTVAAIGNTGPATGSPFPVPATCATGATRSRSDPWSCSRAMTRKSSLACPCP